MAVQPWKMPRPAGSSLRANQEHEGTSEKSRYTIEIILAVVVLSWALVFLGYQMGSSGSEPESSKGMDALTVGAGAAEDGAEGLGSVGRSIAGLTETRSQPQAPEESGAKATRHVAKGEIGVGLHAWGTQEWCYRSAP